MQGAAWGASEKSVNFWIATAVRHHPIDPDVLKEALREEDSGFDENAYNKKRGEMGMAQIQPDTWRAFKCEGVPWFGQDAVTCMAKILHARIGACGTVGRGLASYNAGTNKCPHTKRRYVQRILARVYRARYQQHIEPRIARRG